MERKRHSIHNIYVKMFSRMIIKGLVKEKKRQRKLQFRVNTLTALDTVFEYKDPINKP